MSRAFEGIEKVLMVAQSLFRSFPKLAGMTGTAATEAEEFSRIYELEVTQIPTNMPVKRTDNSDVVFRNTDGRTVISIQAVSTSSA